MVEGASSLERFWKKDLPVQRNTSKICNDVISACYEDSNVNETLMITNFHLNSAVLLIFFKIFVNGDVVNAQTRGVLPLKNPIEPSWWTVYRSIIWLNRLFHLSSSHLIPRVSSSMFLQTCIGVLFVFLTAVQAQTTPPPSPKPSQAGNSIAWILSPMLLIWCVSLYHFVA